MSEQHVVVVDDEQEEVVLEFPPLSNESIREAVRLWRHDQAQATEKYNHINKWNTSQVTDMRRLFMNYKEFNDNISEWDVSNVTNMSCMFWGASSFNQDVSNWDVSNVTIMDFIFHRASSFNQDVSAWDVSNVTDMSNWKSLRMITGAEVQLTVVTYCGRSSFFEDDCLTLPRSERQQLFSAAFSWGRRKYFVLFLVSQVYLQYSNSRIIDCERPQEACDMLFDVEDLDREICKFL